MPPHLENRERRSGAQRPSCPARRCAPRWWPALGIAITAAFGVLGGCSGTPAPAPTTAALTPSDLTASVSATATVSTALAPTTSLQVEASAAPTAAVGGDPTTPPPGAVPLPTSFTPVEQTIRDPDLGHEIVVTKIARNLAWPAGYDSQQSAFELLAVEMRWTPGTAYTAPIRAVDFSVATTSQYPNRPDALLDPTLTAAAWTILPAQVGPGQPVTGWMVFKIEPRGATSMRLDYTRPAIQVSGTTTTFPRTVFSVQLLAAPTMAPPAS